MGNARGYVGVSLFGSNLSLEVNQKRPKFARDGTKTQSFQIRAPKHNSIIKWTLTQLHQSNAPFPEVTPVHPRDHFNSCHCFTQLTVSTCRSTLFVSEVSRFHTGVFGSTTSSFINRHRGSCTNGQFWMSVISVCTRSWQIG